MADENLESHYPQFNPIRELLLGARVGPYLDLEKLRVILDGVPHYRRYPIRSYIHNLEGHGCLAIAHLVLPTQVFNKLRKDIGIETIPILRDRMDTLRGDHSTYHLSEPADLVVKARLSEFDQLVASQAPNN